MKNIPYFFALYFVLINISCDSISQKAPGENPAENLPAHITRLTYFGQRADWSHDGKRILFLEKTFGDVYEIDTETGIIRPVTHHFFHEGFTRALYLANGDILLSGAKDFDSENPWPSRSEEHAELWVLKKDHITPPFPLGEKCSEGPAVSRTQLRIAWTQKNGIYLSDIIYENDTPRLVKKKLVINGTDISPECHLESQNFRPPEDQEIIFSTYNYQGCEVFGVHLKTNKITNYTNAINQYDEPEGIFPDGKHTLVESDRHVSKNKTFMGHQYIDLHKLTLDGSGIYERLTYFNDYPGFKASNPVVSDDGKFIAFQMAKIGDPAGVGRGLFLFDFVKYQAGKK